MTFLRYSSLSRTGPVYLASSNYAEEADWVVIVAMKVMEAVVLVVAGVVVEVVVVMVIVMIVLALS